MKRYRLRYSALLALSCVALLYLPIHLSAFDIKHDNGIVGLTRKNGEGCVCHSLTPTPGVNVWITGPASLPPGGGATYVLYMTGGAGIAGGFNVATARGVISNLTGETRIIGDELTHSTEKNFSAGEVQWSFRYDAPGTVGPDTLFSVGNSTNDDHIPTEADTWNFGNDFVIHVSSVPPNPVPGMTGWGIVILSLVLLLSGGILLGRKRSL